MGWLEALLLEEVRPGSRNCWDGMEYSTPYTGIEGASEMPSPEGKKAVGDESTAPIEN